MKGASQPLEQAVFYSFRCTERPGVIEMVPEQMASWAEYRKGTI